MGIYKHHWQYDYHRECGVGWQSHHGDRYCNAWLVSLQLANGNIAQTTSKSEFKKEQ